jgi:hypothetical protein
MGSYLKKTRFALDYQYRKYFNQEFIEKRRDYGSWESDYSFTAYRF